MALKDELEFLAKAIDKNTPYRGENKKLIDIYEGDLRTHLEYHLTNLFSPEVYSELIKLLVPINVLQRIVDKLSKIYQEAVTRYVEEGTEQDSELLGWYEEKFKINQKMNVANEFFNLTKACLVEPFLDQGMPELRVIPNDRFFMFSNNVVDPTKPTHVTLIYDEYLKKDKPVKVYMTTTDDEVLVWDSDLEIRTDIMQRMWAGLPQSAGINPYGKINYVYASTSSNLLVPKHDTDMLDMTLEIPAQLSFLNYGVAYNAFSIVYGIDVDDEGLKRAPNAFWNIKSDKTSDKKPEIGSIKPQIDISETLNFIQAELAFWLNSKGIKPGAIGSISTENMASGISKMIDEMDTFEARKRQIDYFENAEKNLWNLIFNYMHPYWVASGLIENRSLFTPTAKVEVKFVEPVPMQTRGELVGALKSELDAGFTSRKRVIKKLNPDFTEQQIDELMEEIDAERTIELPETQEETEEAQEVSGKTTKTGDHSHTFKVDGEGNGLTSTFAGHSHEIISYVVQPSEGHTHALMGPGEER